MDFAVCISFLLLFSFHSYVQYSTQKIVCSHSHTLQGHTENVKVTIRSWNVLLSIVISISSCRAVFPYPPLLINMAPFCLLLFPPAQLQSSLSARDSHNFVCHTEIPICYSLWIVHLGFPYGIEIKRALTFRILRNYSN